FGTAAARAARAPKIGFRSGPQTAVVAVVMDASLPVILDAPEIAPDPRERGSTSASGAAANLDPRTYARGLACVHCGLCLPACPTYTTNFNEADSPRGRIQLMMGLASGEIAASDSVRKHLDLCLDCRA